MDLYELFIANPESKVSSPQRSMWMVALGLVLASIQIL